MTPKQCDNFVSAIAKLNSCIFHFQKVKKFLKYHELIQQEKFFIEITLEITLDEVKLI